MSKEMTRKLEYEQLHMVNKNMPILLSLHENDSDGRGCHFHWHEQIEFYYVVKGGLVLNVDGKESFLNAGDVGYVGWGKPHRGSKFMNETKHYIFQVDLKYLPMMSDYPVFYQPSETILPFIRNDHRLIHCFRRIISEYKEQKEGYDIEIIASTMKIFTHLLRYYKVKPYNPGQKQPEIRLSHIHDILHYIGKHYQSTISLDTLAHQLGLSKSYMCRLFKQHTSLTIIRYINELKCNYAASLLLDGASLQEACEEVGYSDYNYFSRVFKQHYGTSPKSIKKS